MKCKNIVIVIMWMMCGRGYAQSFPADIYRGYNNLPLAYNVDHQQIHAQDVEGNFVAQIIVGNSEIRIYKEDSQDCREQSKDCHFYYTPFFDVERDADQKVIVMVDSSRSNIDSFGVTLRNRDLDVQEMILMKLNSMYGKTFEVDCLRVVPLISIEITVPSVKRDITSSQAKFVTVFAPNIIDDYQEPVIADQILRFELPKNRSADFLKKIRRNMKLNISYTWKNLKMFNETSDENDQKMDNQSTMVRFDTRKNIPLLFN